MFLEVFILALIVIFIGGDINRLHNLKISHKKLIVYPFIIYFLFYFVAIFSTWSISDIIHNNFGYIHLATYFFVILAILLNYKIKGFKSIASGMILNYIAMLFNEGKMPVSSEALLDAGLYEEFEILKKGAILTHSLINNESKINYLSDIIKIPRPYILPKVISLGDILIAVGLLFTLVYYGYKEVDDGKG